MAIRRERRDVQCSEGVAKGGRGGGSEARGVEEEEEEEEVVEDVETGRGENSPRGREPSESGFSVETSGMDKLRSDCPRG